MCRKDGLFHVVIFDAKLAYIVHLSEMKGRQGRELNGPGPLNCPSSVLCGWKQWSIASTSAHNMKHQISQPVESTFGSVQRGHAWKEHGIKCAKVQ